MYYDPLSQDDGLSEQRADLVTTCISMHQAVSHTEPHPRLDPPRRLSPVHRWSRVRS